MSSFKEGYLDHRSGKIRARNIWRVIKEPLRLGYYSGVAYSLIRYWLSKVSIRLGLIFIYLRLLFPKTGKPRLIGDTSLIILTPNLLSQRLRFCLRSVMRYEIPQEILVFQINKNFSYSVGVNQGIRATKTKYIVLLNDDCFVKDKWLSSLVKTAEENPKIGIVGGKLLYTNGRLWCTEGYITPEGKTIQETTDPEKPHAVRGFVWCCMLIKRELVNSIGFFDETYSPFLYEDADFCYRARLSGWLVYYAPECEVYHVGGATLLKQDRSYRKKIEEKNMHIFLQRWRTFMESEAV